MAQAQLVYDADADVVFSDQRGVRLETRADIDAHFEFVLGWWKKTCKGRRVDFIVQYDGFEVNLRESDYFASQMREATQVCAGTIVRYGGDTLQRSAARLRSLKVHAPSNLYASRQEALEVLKRIRAGDVTVALTPATAKR